VENRLFATLDPTTRRLRFPREREVILTDTVGFIRDIPRDLLNAFRSTLEELREADLLIHLVDGSSDSYKEQIKAVQEILVELAMDNTPQILVFNKADMMTRERREELAGEYESVIISAVKRDSLSALTDLLEKELWKDME